MFRIRRARSSTRILKSRCREITVRQRNLASTPEPATQPPDCFSTRAADRSMGQDRETCRRKTGRIRRRRLIILSDFSRNLRAETVAVFRPERAKKKVSLSTRQFRKGSLGCSAKTGPVIVRGSALTAPAVFPASRGAPWQTFVAKWLRVLSRINRHRMQLHLAREGSNWLAL